MFFYVKHNSCTGHDCFLNDLCIAGLFFLFSIEQGKCQISAIRRRAEGVVEFSAGLQAAALFVRADAVFLCISF